MKTSAKYLVAQLVRSTSQKEASNVSNLFSLYIELSGKKKRYNLLYLAIGPYDSAIIGSHMGSPLEKG